MSTNAVIVEGVGELMNWARPETADIWLSVATISVCVKPSINAQGKFRAILIKTELTDLSQILLTD